MKAFDQIRNSQSEGEPQQKFERVEGCPQCHESDLNLVAGRQRIDACSEHQVYWFTGLNPSEPTAEVEETQRKAWAAMGLDNYEKVQPWILGQTATA